jgi:hypothetical protein
MITLQETVRWVQPEDLPIRGGSVIAWSMDGGMTVLPRS